MSATMRIVNGQVYDPKNNIICAIHAGWKGAYKKIIKKNYQ